MVRDFRSAMLNPLLHSHLSRSFRQLALHRAQDLNLWSLTPCIHAVRVPRSTLGERRLATSITETRKKSSDTPYKPRALRLRTLRPERLLEVGQEVIDLSGKLGPVMPTLTDESSLQCVYDREYLKNNLVKYTPFPENTRGVFYFNNAPGMPELCAGVRFRICDSAAEFEHGRDLLDSRGDVWGYKILELMKHKGQQTLLELLRAENLIDEGLINDINKLKITENVRHYQYSLFNPFCLNVGHSHSYIQYVTRAKVVRLTFPMSAFSIGTSLSPIYPMTGSIKVQFELSDLPEHKKLGPTLVVRVLDILKPITVNPLYDQNSVPVPVPGTLLHRIKYREKRILCIPLKRQRMADDLLELMTTSWA